MKKISSLFFYLIPLCLLLFFTAPQPLSAQSLLNEQAKGNQITQLLLQSLEGCLREKLQTEQQMQYFATLAEHAKKQITQACREGKPHYAYRIAQQYAATAQGKAALQCAQRVKPFASQPFIKQQLGKHRATVNSLVNGQVPREICL